ncbi:MAG TPA: transcriptional regulator NrdR [Pirellulales bacterium]|jgi:transcriptional repressor NrdR|nr:transcriptional regulator NrdR [Pirellulales bacterium]
MRCPFCRCDNDRVIDSRASEDGFAIRRRRECECGRRFTTYERIEELTIKVIKKDGSRVPFDRIKIKQGLQKACWKRPISEDQIEAVVAAVENEIYRKENNEIESQELGAILMEHLRKLDQVAYVRFASVYREFKDARDFVQAIGQLEDQGRKK